MLMSSGKNAGRSRPAESPYALQTVELVKAFGDRTVVDSISFYVRPGEIVGTSSSPRRW